MANSDKGSIEFIRGSIGDLIFRIETLTSDRDTIKLCVRAAQELAWLESQLTKRAPDVLCTCQKDILGTHVGSDNNCPVHGSARR